MLFLEERVRTGGGHLSEVRCNGAESGMLLFGEDEGELALMQAVGIDLLVMEPGGADEGVRREACEGAGAQARVGGEFPVLGQPLRKGTGAQAQAETFLDPLCHAPTRLATVIETETLQDHLERGALPLHNLRCEDAVAVMAVPELDRLQLLIPLAFPGDAPALTVDAALGIRTDEGPARMGSRTG